MHPALQFAYGAPNANILVVAREFKPLTTGLVGPDRMPFSVDLQRHTVHLHNGAVVRKLTPNDKDRCEQFLGMHFRAVFVGTRRILEDREEITGPELHAEVTRV